MDSATVLQFLNNVSGVGHLVHLGSALIILQRCPERVKKSVEIHFLNKSLLPYALNLTVNF